MLTLSFGNTLFDFRTFPPICLRCRSNLFTVNRLMGLFDIFLFPLPFFLRFEIEAELEEDRRRATLPFDEDEIAVTKVTYALQTFWYGLYFKYYFSRGYFYPITL